MLSFLVDEFARRAARLSPRRRLRPDSEVVKLNVGAGLCVAPGWINIDGSIHALCAGAPRRILSLMYRSTGTLRQLMDESEYIRRLKEHRFVFYNLEHGLPFESNVAD